MAEIVQDHAASLKSQGFKKRRHCFNRLAGDGLVHVVYFWMAPKEPPAWTEVPGLRERHYGQFRLDAGVYVPEMKRSHTPRSEWINDYDCHLRRIFSGRSGGEGTAFGWSLADPEASAAAGIVLGDHLLPWLDRFPDRESVLAAFEQLGPLALGLSPAGPLDIADVYRALSRPADERRVLEGYVAEPVLGNHAGYLAKYLRQHGHDDLVDEISIRSA